MDAAMEFAPLTIARRAWKDNSATRYRVFRTDDDFVVVEAETATEALEQSNIPNPIRVERYVLENLLTAQDEMMAEPEGVVQLGTLEILSRQTSVIDSKTILHLLRQQREKAAIAGN